MKQIIILLISLLLTVALATVSFAAWKDLDDDDWTTVGNIKDCDDSNPDIHPYSTTGYDCGYSATDDDTTDDDTTDDDTTDDGTTDDTSTDNLNLTDLSIDGQDIELPDVEMAGNSSNTKPNFNTTVASGSETMPAIFFENSPSTDVTASTVPEGNALTGKEIIDGNSGSSNWESWQDYAISLIDIATVVDPDDTKGNNPDFGDVQTVNNPAVPQITYIADPKKFAGKVEGSGILILDGAPQFTGTFLFEGLIIILTRNITPDENGIKQLQKMSTGNSSIVGGIIVAGDGPVNITTGGSSEIYYSTEALQLARDLNDYTTVTATTTYGITSWKQN